MVRNQRKNVVASAEPQRTAAVSLLRRCSRLFPENESSKVEEYEFIRCRWVNLRRAEGRVHGDAAGAMARTHALITRS
jgi:hypothetical protein